MKTQKYTPHILATSVIFTLGNTIISVPCFNLIDLIIMLIVSLVVMLLARFLIGLGRKNKAVFLCIAFVVGIIAIYGASITILDYIRFLKTEQMPLTNVLLLVAVIGAVISFFVISKTSALYKYCLFAFVIISIIMIVCFIGGIKGFDYKNLNTQFFKFTFSFKDFLRLFLPLAILPFFNFDESTSIKPTIYGVALGFLGLVVALLQSVLTMGIEYNITYPYLKAVSVISSGSLFTRLDGAVWFLFFVCAIVKAVVCIKVAIEIIGALKK